MPWVNHLWTGLWCSLTYTTALLVALSYHPAPIPEQYKLQMTMAVLYGIFPVVLAGMGLSWFVHKWRLKPLQMFMQARREVKAGTLTLNTAAAFKAIYRCNMIQVSKQQPQAATHSAYSDACAQLT